MNPTSTLRVPVVAVTVMVLAFAMEVVVVGSGPLPAAPGPAASPPSSSSLLDDASIAYQWNTDTGDGIYLVAQDGTAGHLILRGTGGGAFHPDWSPDGAQLAFSIESSVIATANADGSDVVPLVACEAPCDYVEHPAWSPDGKRIAFLRADAAEGFYTGNAIEVLDLAIGSSQTVLQTTAPEFEEYPRWSPDGTSLVVELQRGPPAAIPVDGPYPHEIGSVIAVADIGGPGLATPRVLTDWDMFATYPDWSPTGDRIVFSTYDLGEWQMTDEASNLYTFKPDGTDLTQLTHHAKGETRDTQPTWTPDGERIIFTQVGKQGYNGFDLPREIAFVDPDGTNLEVIDGIGATHPRLRPIP